MRDANIVTLYKNKQKRLQQLQWHLSAQYREQTLCSCFSGETCRKGKHLQKGFTQSLSADSDNQSPVHRRHGRLTKTTAREM